MTRFLKGCDIVYPRNVHLDPSYIAACYSEAKRRGFDIAVLGKTLDVAIALGDTNYRHLQNYSTRIFIAMYTAVAAHIDDSYHLYKEGLEDFVDRFLRHEQQQFEALDHWAALIREIPEHWGSTASNFITLASMDFIASTVIEGRIEEMKVSNLRKNYTTLPISL